MGQGNALLLPEEGDITLGRGDTQTPLYRFTTSSLHFLICEMETRLPPLGVNGAEEFCHPAIINELFFSPLMALLLFFVLETELVPTLPPSDTGPRVGHPPGGAAAATRPPPDAR